MTPSATEPRTAKQQRSQQVGEADPLPNGPEVGDGDSGGSGGIPPRFPPADEDWRGRGGRPERSPRWWRLMLWGAVLIVLGTLLSFLGSLARPESES